MIRALILHGYGINCEREMALACTLAGAKADLIHAKSLLDTSLDPYHLLMLPGGFSFGDELGAGKAFANRLSYVGELKQQLLTLVERGGCILGVCNGFQLLVKLGLLPGFSRQDASLTHNDSCQFENRWVHHKTLPSPCIFTHNLEHLYLPVRHGEGKFVVNNPALIETLQKGKQIVFQYATPNGEPTQDYPHNPNGSQDAIAGICDPTGQILGMMAHPEAALFFTHHPQWTRLKEQTKREGKVPPDNADGLSLFKNAVNFAKGAL